MAQLQYIGARYVPKWYVNSIDQTSNWELNVEYEPLTWVTTLNNHLYLSKKTVPDNIGTPAMNTEYWLDMGEMTGDLQNIQDEIDAIVAAIGDLSDLDTTDKSTLVAAINEVFNSGGGGGSDTPDIYDGVVFMTDSFGENINPNISTLVPSEMGWDPSQYEMIVQGGAGFGPATPYHYLTVLQNKAADILTKFGSADKVTCVIVTGGTNDSYYGDTQSAIVSAIESFGSYVNTTYPNAKIKVFFTGWTDAHNGVANLNLNNLRETMKSYQEIIKYNGAFYDLHNILHQHSLFNGDHIHPTAAAQLEFAKAITSLLNDGEYHVIRDLEVSVTAATGVTINGTVRFRFKQRDDIIEMEVNRDGGGLWYFNKTYQACTASGDIQSTLLGTIPDWLISGNNRGNAKLQVVAICGFGGNAYPQTVEFTFESGNVYFSIGVGTSTAQSYTVNVPNTKSDVISSFDC